MQHRGKIFVPYAFGTNLILFVRRVGNHRLNIETPFMLASSSEPFLDKTHHVYRRIGPKRDVMVRSVVHADKLLLVRDRVVLMVGKKRRYDLFETVRIQNFASDVLDAAFRFCTFAEIKPAPLRNLVF